MAKAKVDMKVRAGVKFYFEVLPDTLAKGKEIFSTIKGIEAKLKKGGKINQEELVEYATFAESIKRMPKALKGRGGLPEVYGYIPLYIHKQEVDTIKPVVNELLKKRMDNGKLFFELTKDEAENEINNYVKVRHPGDTEEKKLEREALNEMYGWYLLPSFEDEGFGGKGSQMNSLRFWLSALNFHNALLPVDNKNFNGLVHPDTIANIKSFVADHVKHHLLDTKKELNIIIPFTFPDSRVALEKYEKEFGKKALAEYKKYSGENYLVANYHKKSGYVTIGIHTKNELSPEIQKLVANKKPKNDELYI